MSSTALKPGTADKNTAKSDPGRLFILDLGVGRILSCKPDGSDLKTIVSEGRKLPDGIVVDVEAGHIYWTNMGNLKANDGSIDRADLDGSNVTSIVPTGGTFTPKQLQLDKKNGKLYWCDREGMRVMRCNLDGSEHRNARRHEPGRPPSRARTRPNGVWASPSTLKPARFTGHKKASDNAGQGRIFRANWKSRRVRLPANRKDIEVLFDGLPEPIDLDLDLANRMMYWTDRGDPPRGNTVEPRPNGCGARQTAKTRKLSSLT